MLADISTALIARSGARLWPALTPVASGVAAMSQPAARERRDPRGPPASSPEREMPGFRCVRAGPPAAHAVVYSTA